MRDSPFERAKTRLREQDRAKRLRQFEESMNRKLKKPEVLLVEESPQSYRSTTAILAVLGSMDRIIISK